MVETIPFDPDALRKDPLDNYGQDKLASEIYLKEPYQQNGFPATIIMPGQISGPGWTIINPWGNTSIRVFHDIADGKEIALPNFGQEILHHIHGHDVVRVFFKALPTKNQASGETFDAEECDHTCHHIARSGIFSIEKTKRLPDYQPKYLYQNNRYGGKKPCR